MDKRDVPTSLWKKGRLSFIINRWQGLTLLHSQWMTLTLADACRSQVETWESDPCAAFILDLLHFDAMSAMCAPQQVYHQPLGLGNLPGLL
jgi:hypothetical protein